MHHVIISLAANRFQKSNLAKARQCLGEVFSDLHYTTEQWTEPLSSNRHDLYLNQLAEGYTELSLEMLNQYLKQIEADFGRNAEKRRLGIVPIDLDILKYDGQRYHEHDWQRPYIANLLGELPNCKI